MFTPLPEPARCARVGNVLLGPMPVKTLASLMSADTAGLLAEAGQFAGHAVDIFEWRADYFANATPAVLLSAGAALMGQAERPVLWTLRTDREGGLFTGSDAEYAELVGCMASSGLFDAIDIELDREGSAKLAARAHAARTCVIMSHHDFQATPEDGVLMDKLGRMHAAGADVLKIAVMPRSPEDVLRLMLVVARARRTFDVPVIAMSMGAAGAVTRVAGSLYGSCATFASIKEASAPGQIQIETLVRYLQAFAL